MQSLQKTVAADNKYNHEQKHNVVRGGQSNCFSSQSNQYCWQMEKFNVSFIYLEYPSAKQLCSLSLFLSFVFLHSKFTFLNLSSMSEFRFLNCQFCHFVPKCALHTGLILWPSIIHQFLYFLYHSVFIWHGSVRLGVQFRPLA